MSSRVTWQQKYSFFFLLGMLLVSLGTCANQINQTIASNNDETSDESYLDVVKQRGSLICGIDGELPGFSFVNQDGKYAGIDVDVCRAVAAALFDDPNQVTFRNLNAEERLTALKAGEIDLLSRNTTQTLSRDTQSSLEFTPTTFYDGQGIMVNQADKIKNLTDLQDKSICVVEKTTSENNLRDRMSQLGINYKPLALPNPKSLYNAYEYNLCQAITGDISQLVVRKTLLANPKEHIILPQIISKEPLAPILVNKDSQWFDVVKWVTYAMIQAEELDINSENIHTYKNSQDAEINRFLGLDSNLGADMGLANDFTVRIIEHVGNYGEIYERNIGQPFGLKRGQNALWRDGGLMYSPPFR